MIAPPVGTFAWHEVSTAVNRVANDEPRLIEPATAEQIAQGIGGRVPLSDIGSVYRNLQALEDIGLVRHVHLGHGPGLHALVVEGEPEYLTCERCADYRAVAPEELDAIRELIARQFGYQASFAHFPIVGLCASCALAVGKRRVFNGRR